MTVCSKITPKYYFRKKIQKIIENFRIGKIIDYFNLDINHFLLLTSLFSHLFLNIICQSKQLDILFPLQNLI